MIRLKKTLATTENKKVKNTEPITYEGIQFRSGLEAFCYKKLKEAGIEALYEQKTYVIHPKFICGFSSMEQVVRRRAKGAKIKDVQFTDTKGVIKPITYTPDFTDTGEDPQEFIIECKGWCNDTFPLKVKMFKKLLTDNNFKGTYYIPRNQRQVLLVVEQILKKRTDALTK